MYLATKKNKRRSKTNESTIYHKGRKETLRIIKDFNRFMYNQSKHKERKHFCMYCLQCFKSESIFTKHVDNCLIINGKQAINAKKG